MPKRGLEPLLPFLRELAPQASVSANSTTSAFFKYHYFLVGASLFCSVLAGGFLVVAAAVFSCAGF